METVIILHADVLTIVIVAIRLIVKIVRSTKDIDYDDDDGSYLYFSPLASIRAFASASAQVCMLNMYEIRSTIFDVFVTTHLVSGL
jgi:hypothetical protein